MSSIGLKSGEYTGKNNTVILSSSKTPLTNFKVCTDNYPTPTQHPHQEQAQDKHANTQQTIPYLKYLQKPKRLFLHLNEPWTI
jgi:hypothetical protein